MDMLKLAAIGAVAFSAVTAQAAVDTVQAPTGYFAPNEEATYDWPYYRGYGEDWGWQHGAIASGFTSANLHISAWDVDAPWEVNEIWAFNSTAADWLLLGSLQGGDDSWGFTDFTLDNSWFADIENGLQVQMKIDVNRGGWYVTLGKSVLTTDGEDPGNPVPGIPEPATWAMLIAGFGMVGVAARRRRTGVTAA